MFDIFTKSIISLGAQMINNAASGHIGMAISSAPIFNALFTRHLNISSIDPKWINRDRFVLSAGHGSAALYATLFFCDLLTIDDIKSFRKGSHNTAGHPEYSKTNYIDASTGPLGQGISNAVGMAIAEKYLANRWKMLDKLIDHYTYVLVGDGDLQEGICYESMSLAGKLKLNKLIVLHDSNDFQLDSSVSAVNIENLRERVESQGWNYYCTNNNVDNISFCIELAKKSIDKPTFIEVKTIIGEGTSKQNSNKAHSFGISEDELKNINEYYNIKWTDFKFEDEIFNYFKQTTIRGDKKYNEWKKILELYQNINCDLVNQFIDNMKGNFLDLSQFMNLDEINNLNCPTKTYLKNLFDQLAKANVRHVMTLSADLASTTNCKLSPNNKSFNEDINSPYVMVGIREFAMGGIQNGILLHGGLICFSGTFLSFADYIKPAIRVGAMCKLPSNYILTHDSYLVGNDGPTHQPYDQIPMLRAIENVYIWRPCDEKETYASLSLILENKSITNCLVLSRQNLKSQPNSSIQKTTMGAYVIYDVEDPDICIVANGSEIDLAFEVMNALRDSFNMNAKIVSCPCLKLFLQQDKNYIKEVLSSCIGTITIEASSDTYWYKLSRYVKKLVSIQADKFGFSDDGINVYKDCGFNVENIVETIKRNLINDF